MLVKGQVFIDDAKKECLHFLHECLWFTELSESFHFSRFEGVCTWNNTFRRVRKISKANIIVMSVCPPARMEQLSSHWTAFHEIWYLDIFRKSVEKI